MVQSGGRLCVIERCGRMFIRYQGRGMQKFAQLAQGNTDGSAFLQGKNSLAAANFTVSSHCISVCRVRRFGNQINQCGAEYRKLQRINIEEIGCNGDAHEKHLLSCVNYSTAGKERQQSGPRRGLVKKVKEVNKVGKVKIELAYDSESGKLLEVWENGRMVVDREQGKHLMSVPEAMTMLNAPGLRMDIERSELANEEQRREWTQLREQMARLFTAIFGEVDGSQIDGAGYGKFWLRREKK